MRNHAFKIACFSLASLAAATFAPVAAWAETAANQIATINIQSILTNSAAAKSAKSQIEAKRNEYQNELKKIEDSLRKEEQAIKEQRSLLSPEALDQKSKEFSTKMNNAQQTQLDKRNRLAEANNQALGSIQDAVLKIVEGMVKNKGIKVVIPTNNLLYATPDLDITKEVLAQLDKDLPTVKVNFNAPAANKSGEKAEKK
jgi:outer membrane protein